MTPSTRCRAPRGRAPGHPVGDAFVVSHGPVSFGGHEDRPFRVACVLKRAGTPVDRIVIAGSVSIEAIHGEDHDEAFAPDVVTAPLVGARRPTSRRRGARSTSMGLSR